MSTQKLIQIYLSREVLLGYSGSSLYFITEYYEQIAGMLLTACMILTSIILQYVKIKSAINRDRREEEKHQQELRQDQDIHNKNLNQN